MEQEMDTTIVENEKMIKQIEKQLRSLDQLKIEAGLQPGAGSIFLSQIPASNNNLQEAYKQSSEMNNSSDFSPHVASDKTKRKSKLAKKMSRRLSI